MNIAELLQQLYKNVTLCYSQNKKR